MRVAEKDVYLRARARAARHNRTASAEAGLRLEVERTTAPLDVATYLEARARRQIGEAASWEYRAALGAYAESQQATANADAERAFALESLANFTASAPFYWVEDAVAPAAEASSLTLEAMAAEAAAAAAWVHAEVGALRTLPLSESVRSVWRRDDAWGRALEARPAGGLLKLTSSTEGVRGVGSAGLGWGWETRGT